MFVLWFFFLCFNGLRITKPKSIVYSFLCILCRGIENRMPSTDTATSGNSEDSKRLLTVECRDDTYIDKSTDNKDVSKARNPPSGVRSRRKSMSALR